MSYTSFTYSNLKISNSSPKRGETITVSVDLTNTGNYHGKEVVQLYINDVVASIARPVKELKGFELVSLNKGETKTIQFSLTDKELGFYNNKGEFLVETGTFNIMVGGNSNEGLKSKFELK